MSGKLLFTLLLASLLIGACKKSSNSPAAKEFVIEGVKDVDMGNAYSGFLDLCVVQNPGNREDVTLTVQGLPAGISVSLEPQSKVIVNLVQRDNYFAPFSQTAHADSGTYPVKITGTSAAYSKSYDFMLRVPKFNGWFVDNEPFRKGEIRRENIIGNELMTVTSYDGYSELEFGKYDSWPTADGTYVYAIGDPYYYPGSVQIAFTSSRNNYRTFYSKSPDTKQLTVIMKDGKARISLPAIEVRDSTSVKIVDAEVIE